MAVEDWVEFLVIDGLLMAIEGVFQSGIFVDSIELISYILQFPSAFEQRGTVGHFLFSEENGFPLSQIMILLTISKLKQSHKFSLLARHKPM